MPSSTRFSKPIPLWEPTTPENDGMWADCSNDIVILPLYNGPKGVTEFHLRHLPVDGSSKEIDCTQDDTQPSPRFGRSSHHASRKSFEVTRVDEEAILSVLAPGLRSAFVKLQGNTAWTSSRLHTAGGESGMDERVLSNASSLIHDSLGANPKTMWETPIRVTVVGSAESEQWKAGQEFAHNVPRIDSMLMSGTGRGVWLRVQRRKSTLDLRDLGEIREAGLGASVLDITFEEELAHRLTQEPMDHSKLAGELMKDNFSFWARWEVCDELQNRWAALLREEDELLSGSAVYLCNNWNWLDRNEDHGFLPLRGAVRLLDADWGSRWIAKSWITLSEIQREPKYIFKRASGPSPDAPKTATDPPADA